MYMPMAKSGVTDIYWSEPWDEAAARQACVDNWGVEPRPTWGTVEWGGHDLRALSNVVFSNGLFDPWHLGGVLHDLSPTVKARSPCQPVLRKNAALQSTPPPTPPSLQLVVSAPADLRCNERHRKGHVWGVLSRDL